MKGPFFFAFLFICLFSFSQQTIYNENATLDNTPQEVAKMVINDLLARTGFMIYRTEQCTAIHYAEACTGFGAARIAGLLKDTLSLRQLSARYSKVIDDNLVNTANHVDANVYGILPLELYRQTKETKFLKQGLYLADSQWDNPLADSLTNQTRYWIDDMDDW